MAENVENEEEGTSEKDYSQEEKTSPRRGSTLEGRVRTLIQNRGYQATTNKIVLGNEFDVWGVNKEDQVAVAECKELYQSGSATPKMIRNFFGKIYDVTNNYGADVHASLFVCISGFTDQAKSLCERLRITPVGSEQLDNLERSEKDLSSRETTLEDETIISLRKERDELREKLNRRQVVRKLSQRVEEYKNQLKTKTLPGFLIPTSISNSFWLNDVEETPFIGLEGDLEDFIVINYPYIQHVSYKQKRFLGSRELYIPTANLSMEEGVVYVEGEGNNELPTSEVPKLRNLLGGKVMSIDEKKLGQIQDFQISLQNECKVSAVKLSLTDELSSRLDTDTVTITADRTTTDDTGESYLTLHARLTKDI